MFWAIVFDELAVPAACIIEENNRTACADFFEMSQFQD